MQVLVAKKQKPVVQSKRKSKQLKDIAQKQAKDSGSGSNNVKKNDSERAGIDNKNILVKLSHLVKEKNIKIQRLGINIIYINVLYQKA